MGEMAEYYGVREYENEMTKKKATPKRVVPAAPSAPKPDLLQVSLDAIERAYPSDRICPGLVLSRLRDGSYYVSICRYGGGTQPNQKQVMHKATGSTLDETLHAVMKEFIEGPEVFNRLKAALA